MAVYYKESEGFALSHLLQKGAEALLGVRPVDRTAASLTTPLFSGRLLAHTVHPGLIATACDVTYTADCELVVEMEAALMCCIQLDGDRECMEVGTFGCVAKCLGRPVLVGIGKKAVCRRTLVARQCTCDMGFLLRPTFFDRFGPQVADDELRILHDFVHADFQTETLMRSSRLVDIARHTLNHSYNSQLSELFLESNTLAFVIEIANLLKNEARHVAKIGRRHYDRVMEARDILDNRIVSPPSTLELARLVGGNVTTLQAHFKRVFGTTIFGYVRSQRLLMARHMLIEHRLDIAEVGYKVGFSTPSAFSAAYRRHFGYPPTQERSCAKCPVRPATVL